MSLINDALKRAKESQQNNPPPPAPALRFQPAEPVPEKSLLPAILTTVALLAGVGLAAFLIWQSFQEHGALRQAASASLPSLPAATAPSPTPPAPAAQPAPETRPTPIAPNVSLQTSVAPATSPAPTPAPAAIQPAPATNTLVAVSEAAPPKPAPPKLQGIIYRADRPSAIINGKIVLVGDRVGEARVVAIDRESVTLAGGGETNVLNLEQ
jgi:hypothetical protein